jgi:hypothetical protein
MCPPDKYYAPYKKAGRHGMTSTSNTSPHYKSFNRSKNLRTEWSRESKASRLKFWKNYESDKFAGRGNAGSRFYTPIEDEPFLSRGLKRNRKNYESDKFSGQGNAGSKFYTPIEENPFSAKKSKSKDYSRLLGAKKIKNKSRKGHEEGLFASNVNRYQDRKTYHIRKRGRLSEKVGIKRLR